MSENKKKFEQEAQAFFADKKNDNVSTLYVTTDGNLFRAEHYAENWKASNPKIEIEIYHRQPKTIADAADSVTKVSEEVTGDDKSDVTADIRQVLNSEYIELFDTKPHHMFSDEKVRGLIDAKKAELASASGDNIDLAKAGENDLLKD